ncbi:hypothetical protein B9G69_001080 [Bdellovibrio sp. SKB1291214]|uniref:hypothetical protein n=1 Tax=Bdellovibrio sp. SKB1291214 TaxID=1732569 RepID=UPI000B519DED|nr:hypothetical protein [Bdellovibrio sp. SKB1291214]UYL09168.1 hypothetical protein B9G69_001080 [Bdellovibrio sp. SKB1291214]
MTSPTNLKANKGQGFIEAVLVLPVALAFISVLIFASYRSLVYFYADAALHEAMICTDSTAASECEREFEEHIRKILLKNETVKINLGKYGSGKSFRVTGKALINVPTKRQDTTKAKFWQTKMTIQKEMKFPLKG